MQPFKIDKDKILSVPLTGAAEVLKPVVYRDGKYYCVLLGPDPDSGVFGRGLTVDEALDGWNIELRRHINENDDEDYIVAYVKSLLPEKKRSSQLQAFYDQFRPVKK